MRLKNKGYVCEIRSENPVETADLLRAGMRSYCARASLITIDDCRHLTLKSDECEEFSSGVLRDIDVSNHGKWQLAKLIACWKSGEITDEAIA